MNALFSDGVMHLASPSARVGNSSFGVFTSAFSFANAVSFSSNADAVFCNSPEVYSSFWVRLMTWFFTSVNSTSFAFS